MFKSDPEIDNHPLYRALKENKDNYTMDSKGGVHLKPEYADKKLREILLKLKDIKIELHR
ncbi:hypothetical protein HEMROJRC1_20450 [Rodentibacter sp. JRC1]|uniref:hypothetical protein n=1 Tax=Rodentibacter sp. JRC1 TaxID=2874504 RepID=UPI001CFE33C0|nr:hypothetical protein [Rodentibacter sp. JRC1]GJI56933.1 hypothetical protein HEMROJRC1_20450 [Rodentibacter sp. JRC1]